MSGDENLTVIYRGQRIVDGIERQRVHAVFRLFNQNDLVKEPAVARVRLRHGQIGEQRQGKELESAVRSHPGRDFDSVCVTEHEVRVAVVLALDHTDVLELRQHCLHVPDPLPVLVLMDFLEVSYVPRQALLRRA